MGLLIGKTNSQTVDTPSNNRPSHSYLQFRANVSPTEVFTIIISINYLFTNCNISILPKIVIPLLYRFTLSIRKCVFVSVIFRVGVLPKYTRCLVYT